MNIVYINSKTEKCFSDYQKLQKKLPFEWVRIIKKIVNHLESAKNFGDFLSLGLHHPEQLKRTDGIFFSLHISPNVRLIIKLETTNNEIKECTEIEIQGVCDYHGDKDNWFIP